MQMKVTIAARLCVPSPSSSVFRLFNYVVDTITSKERIRFSPQSVLCLTSDVFVLVHVLLSVRVPNSRYFDVSVLFYRFVQRRLHFSSTVLSYGLCFRYLRLYILFATMFCDVGYLEGLDNSQQEWFTGQF